MFISSGGQDLFFVCLSSELYTRVEPFSIWISVNLQEVRILRDCIFILILYLIFLITIR